MSGLRCGHMTRIFPVKGPCNREGSWERRGVSAAAHAAFEASTATASACKVQEKLQVQGPLFYLGGGLAASSSYNSSSPTAFCNTHTTPAASYGGS
ncbi:hypothetical protein WJX84_001777 [Apatococcus fuscideae]|uniref:Uncharacterized protein n=1 Tax=Apatococcus fuscideae TaxID=2026836 RepID=A0AAW1SR72_9CHLO